MKCIALIFYIPFVCFLKVDATTNLTPPTNRLIAASSTNPAFQKFINTYNNLMDFYLLPPQGDCLEHMLEQSTLIEELNNSFFTYRQFNTLPTVVETEQFLNDLRIAYVDISDFITQKPSVLSDMFRMTVNFLITRYSQAKIEKMVSEGKGFLGRDVIKGIPVGPQEKENIFKNTILYLVGRVFVVKNENGQSSIVSTSSGMVVPHKVAGIMKYDQIVTCCHSMLSEELSPNLEFYFVRAEGLDPTTGLSKPSNIGKTLKKPIQGAGYDEEIGDREFIEYLRMSSDLSSSNVRRIVQFRSISQSVAAEPAQYSPRYHFNKDCGYAALNKGFALPDVPLAKVNILQTLPNGDYDYYALGYGGFPYCYMPGQSRLADDMQFSPLIMTKGQKTATNVFSVADGYLSHEATTTNGMSGGPILRFDQEKEAIDVLGVVARGGINGSSACRFIR